MLNWVEISRKKILENVSFVKKKIGSECKIMAVVKANAYGHDLVKVAQLIEANIDWFAVANIFEAVAIRKAGVKKPILVLGYIEIEDYKNLFEYEICPAIYNFETLKSLGEASSEKRVKLKTHLKIDTGMNRMGFRLEEIERMLLFLKNYEFLEIVGVYSHFYNENDEDICEAQIEIMHKTVEQIKKAGYDNLIVHMSKSKPMVKIPMANFDMVRIGGILYGLAPYCNEVKIAASFKSKVAVIKGVKSGMAVGYDGCFVANRNMRVAVVTVGYADGYRSFKPNTGHVLIRGKKCPVLGRVCMNQMMVDVSLVDGIELGDEVVLIGEQLGEQISPKDYSQETDCVLYETIARIPDHVERVFVD